jgi:hypothetical protein
MLSQLSKDYVVMVDAHSNSPIFVEDQRSLAFDLFKTGIITKQRLVEMVNPPMKDSILQELETVIIPADEQRAKMQQAEVAAKIEHKGK